MKKGRHLDIIAYIRTDFETKFGVPRQSGLVPELKAQIIFEPEYRREQALIGLEEFSHLWLIWDFSQVRRENWSATVFPPKLGGKEKRGVFATRSPFRPNPIGLSCVKIEQIGHEGELAPYLLVSGADLMDGTPIYDIKPYLPYTDARPEAVGGFGQEHREDHIKVSFPAELLEKLPAEKREAAMGVLRQDPRAAYHKGQDYLYGMAFAGWDIRFTVTDDGVLEVKDVVPGGSRKVK